MFLWQLNFNCPHTTFIIGGGRFGVFSLKKITLNWRIAVAGRRFRDGIRTTGPSDNFRDHGSGHTHAHTGTASIHLSLALRTSSFWEYFPKTTFLLIQYSFCAHRLSFLHGPCSTDTQWSGYRLWTPRRSRSDRDSAPSTSPAFSGVSFVNRYHRHNRLRHQITDGDNRTSAHTLPQHTTMLSALASGGLMLFVFLGYNDIFHLIFI
jgi:hypothetical protein